MSIDCFLDRTYNKNTYNCAHFVSEVWAYLTGESITNIMQGFLLPVKLRNVPSKLHHCFKKLDKPSELCIVLMQRPRTEPHVGLFYKNKLLHITEQGVHFSPLDVATLGFKNVRFYKCLKK